MDQGNDYVGKQIGNYRILEKLASGSYGCVYKAQHIFMNSRIVALKILSAHAIQDTQSFLNEARLLETLKDSHILRILDAGVTDDTAYLVVEYAPNGSLRDRLNQVGRRPTPTDEALTILRQVGKALQCAHKKNIIHRDLKPENILFNAAGNAVLGDFGIATMLETASVKPVSAAGTPAYMAPEQFQSKACKESDQYALGCIAYELFTGRRPFSADNYFAMAMKHSMNQPLPPSQHNRSPILRQMGQAYLKVGSCFTEGSFTCSFKQASATLSTGLQSRGTHGTQCFC